MGESGIKRQQWGLLQALRSDDLNDVSNLEGRALIEAIWAMSFGDAYRAVAAGVAGVVGGFTVTAQVGTLNVTVAPGLALIPRTPDDSTTDSNMVWVQNDASQTLSFAGLVDPIFSRLVTIEIEFEINVFKTENRPQLDPSTGQYTLVAFDVVVGGRPKYYVTAGAASAAPVVAPGTVGRIPLAIVKLPSAASGFVAFTDPYVSVLMCRPLLAALGGRLTTPRSVQGGGCSVGNSGAGGAFQNTQIVDVGDTRAELNGLPARAAGPAEFNGNNVRTPNTTTPAGILATARAAYAYAVPPPWNDDYGQVAPRESFVRNPNTVALFFTPESVVLGENSTFVSLAYTDALGFNEVLLRNCIIIFDTLPPEGLSYGASGTAPPRVNDMRGPHLSTIGGGTITLDTTQDVTWGGTQTVGDAVYIGSVSSLGTAPVQFMAQSYQGKGHVRVIDEAVTAGTTYRPTREYVASTGILDPIYPGKYPGMLNADDEVLPPFVHAVDLSGTLSVGGVAGAVRLQLASEYGYGAPQISPALLGFWTVRYAQADLPNSAFGGEVIPVERNALGRSSIYFQGGAGIATGTVILTGYHDPILAAR